MEHDCSFNTRLLHGKASRGYGQREILPPVSQVTAFRYESMEELERVFAHKSMGYAYTRIGNPTLAAFEQKISEMEGGAGAICTSSGMSAITAALQAVCQSGDEIIAGTGLYGGTIDLLRYAEIASNIGDIRTLVIHPASTLYIHSSQEEKEAAGVFEDMVRVSVGIEDREDLIGDFICAVRESKE